MTVLLKYKAIGGRADYLNKTRVPFIRKKRRIAFGKQPTICALENKLIDQLWLILVSPSLRGSLNNKQPQQSLQLATHHFHLISTQFYFISHWHRLKSLLLPPWASYFLFILDAACTNQCQNAGGLLNIFFSKLSQVKQREELQDGKALQVALIKLSCTFLFTSVYPFQIAPSSVRMSITLPLLLPSQQISSLMNNVPLMFHKEKILVLTQQLGVPQRAGISGFSSVAVSHIPGETL